MTSAAPAGLVVVDKPGGMTSHDVVARVRRMAGTRKVGHAGTLDPMATGVLVLGVGRATRLLGHLMLTRKRYTATVRLGERTTTDDADGEVVATASSAGLDAARVRAAFTDQIGELEQIPSAASAVKIDGKRAYQRVRDGEEVALKPRRVIVHDLRVDEVRLGGATTEVDLEVSCSSGTYIRAIARDAGETLGVGGHLTALRRTEVGPYRLDSARTLDQWAEEFTPMPLAAAARAAFTSVDLDAAAASAVRHGRKLELPLQGTTALFAPDGEFLALYGPSETAGAQHLARAVAVFVQ